MILRLVGVRGETRLSAGRDQMRTLTLVGLVGSKKLTAGIVGVPRWRVANRVIQSSRWKAHCTTRMVAKGEILHATLKACALISDVAHPEEGVNSE